MSEEKYSLPSMEYSFHISIIGQETKKNYEGDFLYKRLNLRDQAEAAKMRCRLNGDLTTLDMEVQVLNEMLSWLRFGLTESPDWWKGCNYGQDLYDVNIIQEIYSKVQTFEENWRKKVYSEDTKEVKKKRKNT